MIMYRPAKRARRFDELDRDMNGQVDRNEFVRYMLLKYDMVSEEDFRCAAGGAAQTQSHTYPLARPKHTEPLPSGTSW